MSDTITHTTIQCTEAQMLALWKQILHLDDVRRDCTVERDDGIDLDTLLTTRIRQWYHHLLLTGPLEWLPVDNVAAETTVATDSSGCVTATLPSRAVRPVAMRLDGWQRAATKFHKPGSREAALQASPLLRGGCCNPAAVARGDGTVKLYSAPQGTSQASLAEARCVAWAADGSYRLATAALSTIGQWDDGI